MFRIGQEVICIKTSLPQSPEDTLPNVKKGKIYTIRGIRPDTGGLYLVGLYLDFIRPGLERGFRRSSFRPLDDRFAEEVLAKIMLECEAEESEKNREEQN